MTKSGRAAAALAVTLALGGCEMLDVTAGVELPAAEGRSYPNLGTVPNPPSLVPASARKADVDQLLASRNAAIREDQQLRSLNPGGVLPPLRPRAAPAARPAAVNEEKAVVAPSEAPPRQEPAPQAAVTMPRPQLPSSLFMGTVVAANERGGLADFQRKVLEDSAAMASRTNGRIRLVGGRSDEEREGVAKELVRLGVARGRIAAAPDRSEASRPAIDVLVEN